MILSPENMKLWNRAGLIDSNGTVTMSLPALDLLLQWAREDEARKRDRVARFYTDGGPD